MAAIETDDAQLEALSTVFTALSENPTSELLHYQGIALSERAGVSADELEAARDTLTQLFPTTDAVWISLLESKVRKVASGDLDADEVHAAFERAEKDYFSIPLYRAHLAFLTTGNLGASGDADVKGDDDGDDSDSESEKEFFSTPSVQDKAMNIVAIAGEHVTEGHLVWSDWRNWWTQVIDATTSQDEKDERIALLKLQFLKRLAFPHSANDETFESYSTFVSSYLPPGDYESALVHATKIRQPAIAAWRRAERWQDGLTSPQAYQDHLSAEQRKRARPQDTHKKRSRDDTDDKNPGPLINIFERAISYVAGLKTAALLASVPAGLHNDGSSAGDNLQIADAWLSTFWTAYVSFLQSEDVRSASLNPAEAAERELAVYSRAVRSLPSSGDLWLGYIRALEFHGQDTFILDVYQNAISAPGRLSAKAISDISIAAVVPTFRLLRNGFDEDIFSGVVGMLEDAIRRCKDAGGDPRLKLELFVVHVILNPTGNPTPQYADESISAALGIWEQAVKHYRKHYHVWTAFIEFLVSTARDLPRARKAFKEFQGSHLAVDYPEAIYEAWITFEERWGDAKQLEEAVSRVRKLTDALNDKRSRDAYRASKMQPQQTSAPAVAVITTPQQQPIDVAMADAEEETPGPSTSAAPADRTSSKRKAEDDAGPDTKKLKPEPPPTAAPKRDREKTTVFVSGLDNSIEEDDLRSLFKDCGDIREVKLTNVEDERVATVEFLGRESVLPALTKDKKRIREKEVSVHQAWQCTLYVTNFPEKSDDASIRELFGKYGTLFDVRWPSKKIKTTRRFCYVQYTSPSSAQASLVLDQFQLEPNRPLTVAISDPARKKDRTDADADQREIHVGGLNRTVVRADLEALFSKYGTVKDVRLALDERGQNKGFAFVEFQDQTSAMAALGANNSELKKRRIAVTLADSRAPAARKPPPTSGLARSYDTANRSVRITNLPKDLTLEQEPLLQQAIEKLVDKVVRLSVSKGEHEAVVELETPADASKLVLLQQVVFQDHTLHFTEEAASRKPHKRNGPGGKPLGGQRAAPAPKAKLAIPATSAVPSGSAATPASDTGGGAAAAFVPRASRGRGGARSGLGHATRTLRSADSRNGPQNHSGEDVEMGSAPAAKPSAGERKDQDAFRKMLGGA